MPPERTSFRAVAGPSAFVRIAARAVLERGVVFGALVWIVVALGGLGQALLTSAVVPDLDLLARMGLGAGGAALGLALPLAVLAGVAAGTRRLADEGAWLGMRTLGVGGRALAGPVAGLVAVAIVGWLAVTHAVEPLARAALRDARVSAAVRVAPVEGRTVRVGAWAATVEGGELLFAGDEVLGRAREWAIRPAEAGVVVDLADGELRAANGSERARFATLAVPIPLVGTSGKVHASERTTPDLVRQVAVSAALGRDAYERWILWKRTLLPVCLLPLALAALPLGLRRRWPVAGIVAGQALTLWGVVRVADQSVQSVGPSVAAVATLVAAVLWAVGAWWGWRDA